MGLIRITAGDAWNDGHGKTDDILYDVNVSSKELEDYFEEGSKILGFNLTEQFEEYEDNVLSGDIYEKLKKQFPENSVVKSLVIEPWETTRRMYSSQFIELYMMIAKLGCDQLTYSLAEYEEIDIGGYGLFS